MMKRRQFLSFVAVATSTSLLSQCARNKATPWQHLTSRDSLLELTLTARSQWRQLGGRSASTLAYNGQVPGPILEARAGDTVRLTLNTQLDAPTNLHYHGLHISPEVDNVFRRVAANESHTYEFTIPRNHPAMTGWYHPHYHLKVASQVFGGLAGPLIVRGDLDQIPELQQAEEALLVLQDFDLTPRGKRVEPHPLGLRWGREGKLLLANGRKNPAISLPQNGLLRLRLINASASRIYQLQLQEHPWFLIATDRGSIAEPTELETLKLSPGERVEVLIPGTREPSDYQISSLPYDRGLGKLREALGEAVDDMPGVARPAEVAIATLRYRPSDRAAPLPLPKQLILPKALPTPQTRRAFVLDHGIDPGAASTGFTINGRSFAGDRVDVRVRLNRVEDWHIVNKASMDHPFHLHTNRFQVVERNGRPERLLAWKDTISLGGYETATIRVRFEDFTGRTAYHCHILDHEDQGMMGVLEIEGV